MASAAARSSARLDWLGIPRRGNALSGTTAPLATKTAPRRMKRGKPSGWMGSSWPRASVCSVAQGPPARPCSPEIVFNGSKRWRPRFPSVVLGVRTPEGHDILRRRRVHRWSAPCAGWKARSLEPGAHTVTCEVRGFAPSRETIIAHSGERNRALNITVRPSSMPAPSTTSGRQPSFASPASTAASSQLRRSPPTVAPTARARRGPPPPPTFLRARGSWRWPRRPISALSG